MTLEKMKKHKKLFLFALMNIFILFIVILASPNFGVAENVLNVVLLEFSLNSPDQRDQQWKQHIQDKIINKLKQSQKVTTAEFIPKKLLLMLGSPEAYYRNMNIRYRIEGKMESYSEKMKIEIMVFDNEIEGCNKEKFRRKRTLRKEMKTLDYWFDRVSNEICSVIEGIPIKEVVFTYCFESIGSENNTVKKMLLKMPKALTAMLKDKDLGKNYIIETFRKKGDIISECQEKDDNGRDIDINVYEYIIRGEIESWNETEEYEVTTEIVMTDREGDDVLIEGFREKYSPDFFEKLADRIIAAWPSINNE